MKIRYKLTPSGSNRSAWDFCSLARQISRLANMGVSRTEFIKIISKMFLDFAKCHSTEFISKEEYIYYRGILLNNRENTFIFEILNSKDINQMPAPLFKDVSPLEELYTYILSDQIIKTQKYFTKTGSMYIPDTSIPLQIQLKNSPSNKSITLDLSNIYKSILILPFQINSQDNGLIVLKSSNKHFFIKNEVEFYEAVTQTIGLAVSDRRAQFSLRERIKELSCLYDINKIVQNRDLSREEVLQDIVDTLPAAFLLPPYASARIKVDSAEYKSHNYKNSDISIKKPIRLWGEEKGFVEITYSFEKQMETSDIMFLKEEYTLLEAVANEVSKYLEQVQLEEERRKMQIQIRHADKLATIGQLSAGIAHEINEPLSIILGFAQLIKKNQNVPKDISKDIDKIINAAMYGREIIRKLLIFARQVPTKKTKVNINDIINEIIQFFDQRFKKENISLKYDLAKDLPQIEADPSQITQVLMNIIVNAIQAMPQGGTLTIVTSKKEKEVDIIISDTGVGMSEEVKKKIFIPFFTTKEVGKGTGLGLSVALGIIESHGGSIEVASEPDRGSTFTIRIPY
jgi:signal transduction histidine kinase